MKNVQLTEKGKVLNALIKASLKPMKQKFQRAIRRKANQALAAGMEPTPRSGYAGYLV